MKLEICAVAGIAGNGPGAAEDNEAALVHDRRKIDQGGVDGAGGEQFLKFDGLAVAAEIADHKAQQLVDILERLQRLLFKRDRKVGVLLHFGGDRLPIFEVCPLHGGNPDDAKQRKTK